MNNQHITTARAVKRKRCNLLVNEVVGGIRINVSNTETKITNKWFKEQEKNTKKKIVSIHFEPTSTIESIGNGSFSGLVSLEKIDIPASVTTIGDEAFRDCRSLTSVNIPSSVTEIGYSAFCDCSSLTSVNIPSPVTTIGIWAFYDCTSLTSVNIPSSVTTIKEYAFRDCSSLTSVNIPSSVTIIGYEAFQGCRSLTSINIPSSVTAIGNNAFQSCRSLTSVSIPSSVTAIGYSAFCDCSSLTSVNIPSSVTKIEINAFCGCSSLTSVNIPPSVTEIGYRAFAHCSSLVNIALLSSIQEISSGALDQCTILQRRTNNYVDDNVTWLKHRFDNLSFHQACYNSDLSTSNIDNLFLSHPNHANSIDTLCMNALHVLACHPEATANLIRRFVELDAEMISTETIHGKRPVDLYLACRGVDLTEQQQGRHLSLFDSIRLGLSWNDIECVMVLEGVRMSDTTTSPTGDDDSGGGLYPFMVAGIEEKCDLEVVYNLAMMNIDAFYYASLNIIGQRRRADY
jgi:hypothetical protein